MIIKYNGISNQRQLACYDCKRNYPLVYNEMTRACPFILTVTWRVSTTRLQ